MCHKFFKLIITKIEFEVQVGKLMYPFSLLSSLKREEKLAPPPFKRLIQKTLK